MKKVLLLTVGLAMVLVLGLIAQAQMTGTPATQPATRPATQPAAVPTYKVGTVAIALPTINADFIEVGEDQRPKMEILCPAVNRLIAVFVTPEDQVKIIKSDNELKMKRYALVEVPRRGEFVNCTPADFQKIAADIAAGPGKELDKGINLAQEELTRRMKDLNLDAIELGKPVPLGTLYSKPDALGAGMVVLVKSGKQNIKVAMALSFIRVKQRLLLVYLYTDYQDVNSIKWLSETSERWATAILEANAK
ncbi:MAG: hypothetical protein WCJ97_11930 [Phycisphaerae bacterium]